MTSVTKATAADSARWNEYLLSNADGCFYQHFAWQQIVTSQFGHHPLFLMARHGDQVVGLLPLVLVSSRMFGRILCSVPYMNFGGPCSESPAVTAELVNEAVRRAGSLNVDYLELRCAAPIASDLAVNLRKVSMFVDLDPDPDAIWNAFTSKHRNNIRRACKQGLTVVSGGIEQLNAFYAVLERSWRDLGTPLYRKSYFEAILRTFPDQTRIHVCLHDGTPVAVALNGHFNGVVEGMWAGGLPSARPLQANYVLYWEMIRDACLSGFRRFHLGRSTTDSGGEQFKSRWNAEPRQLYWYYYRPNGGPMPALNVDNPRYRLAIAAWRKLPLWATRRLGPPLAGRIP